MSFFKKKADTAPAVEEVVAGAEVGSCLRREKRRATI